MARNRKFTQNRNIILVCEGSTTEFGYFTDLKRYLVEHGIIQNYELKIIPDSTTSIYLSNNSNRPNRHLMGNRHIFSYYEMQETDEKDYIKYKAQPIRYLREAQLFCNEGTYTEGWAVYDKDKHPALQDAEIFLQTDDRLHAAFSAYSFEEWLLLHFEYTTKVFYSSECKDSNDHEYRCGSVSANAEHDCKGIKCLGGLLRHKGYITDYSKKDKELFSTYTLNKNGDINIKPFINATRLRAYNIGKKRIDCDTYTDVDLCVLHLLKKDHRYEWKHVEEPFSIGQCKLIIHRIKNKITIQNLSNVTFLCTPTSPIFCNNVAEPISQIFDNNEVIFINNETRFIDINNNQFLMVNDSNTTIIIEL